MKLNKKRIVVSALALATGVCLAGSVTGTIAWYQYSTRASAIYNFTSAGGTRGSLQINLGGSNDNWYTRLTHDDISNYLSTAHSGDQLVPITSGPMSKESPLPELFYKEPLPKHGPYAEWRKADNHNYISLPLQLRYVDHKNGDDIVCTSKRVYLTKLSITSGFDSFNITESIRFHVSAYNKNDAANSINRLVSKSGGKILTHGALDLDCDGKEDVVRPNGSYDFNGGQPQIVDYGEGEQESFVASVDANESNGYYPLLAEYNEETSSLDKLLYDIDKSKSIGLTGLDNEDVLNVIITIWIEGWQNLSNGSIWSSDSVGSSFNIDFEFTAN